MPALQEVLVVCSSFVGVESNCWYERTWHDLMLKNKFNIHEVSSNPKETRQAQYQYNHESLMTAQ